MSAKFGGQRRSASPTRETKRNVNRLIKREARRRSREVAKLDSWMRRNPKHPLVVKLRAQKAGLQVVEDKDMGKQPRTLTKEDVWGERRTPAGVILPPGVAL